MTPPSLFRYNPVRGRDTLLFILLPNGLFSHCTAILFYWQQPLMNKLLFTIHSPMRTLRLIVFGLPGLWLVDFHLIGILDLGFGVIDIWRESLAINLIDFTIEFAQTFNLYLTMNDVLSKTVPKRLKPSIFYWSGLCYCGISDMNSKCV